MKDKKKEDIRKNVNVVGKTTISLLLVAISIVFIFSNKSNKSTNLKDNEITLETFEKLSPLDFVIMDMGIIEQDEKLERFVQENKGTFGLHVYKDEESEDTYAFISGEEGMEPLAFMLYGVAQQNNEVVIGYNFVEASQDFQDEIPTMLLKLEVEDEIKTSGYMVYDETQKDYQDILDKYHESHSDDKNNDETLEEEITKEE